MLHCANGSGRAPARHQLLRDLFIYGLRVRTLLFEGAGSAPTAPADRAHFDVLRSRVRQGVQG